MTLELTRDLLTKALFHYKIAFDKQARTGGGDYLRVLAEARQEAFTVPPSGRRKVEALAERVVESHREQNHVNDALAEVLTPCGIARFPYPFPKLEGAFTKNRYYYLSSNTHVMAAYCDGRGKLDFYDPNVGEIVGGSPRFVGPYLMECVDASFEVMERPVAEKSEKVLEVRAYTKARA